jgi:hypothetical protein
MDALTSPVAKRQRTEDFGVATTPEIKHSTPWFNDGNIVLQVESTQFRVFRGVLATASTVFNDMFSIPQPPSPGGELVEGCLVVHLQDSAQDWQYGLKALFERR